MENAFRARTDMRGPDECWPWTGYIDTYGYGVMSFKGKKIKAHRASFQLANGYLPELVCHHCDNPVCVNPAHLFGGTPSDNMKDKVAKDRQSKGHNAKLTEENVRTILSSSEVQQVLADRFGVSQPIISQIKRRKLWSHVS